MKKIPENDKDVRDILREQLSLLAEASEREKYNISILVALTKAMNETAKTLLE